ncbi:MarR family transcriptional regulator [Desulfobacula sp.]|uniref:MarR family winged helix-turn-helix transcriptional regulator n=1 Tax=Desulfobacula sp. TaxID=2593537 RepID=UPI00260C6974|nr:MarR family transcriptional regulator [Desulfobacula sp.]
MVNKKLDWGGYKSDLEVDEKLMLSIVRTSERLKKMMGSIFKNYGLTFAQYNLLRILDSSPNMENTLTVVSRIMLVSGANLTGVAKRLEKNGFIIKRIDTNDDRRKFLELTTKGKNTLKNIYQEKEACIKKYMSTVSGYEKEEMLTRLKLISDKVK